jgi:hypothetical protein
MTAEQVPLVSLMSLPYCKAVLVHSSILLSLFMVNTAVAAEQRPARKRPTKQEQPAPTPPPAPPPPPPTLEQMPALPPKVRFSNGLLSIVAENSTLGDILRAVRTQTGAAVEIPSNATERVVTHLGPGPAREVLASLLNGSHFNYVMLGSATNPSMVDRVILTSKSGGVSDAGAAMPPGQKPPAAAAMDEPETPGVDISEQPGDDAAETSANEENQPQQPNGQPQVKTPEQLLRELQQQQLLQQQQQQQGAPAGAPGQPEPNRPPP